MGRSIKSKCHFYFVSSLLDQHLHLQASTGWEGVQMFSLGADSTRLETTSIKGRARPAGSAARSDYAQSYRAVYLFNFHTHTDVHCFVFGLLRSELGTPTVSILASHNVVPKSDSDHVPNEIVISESRQYL